MTVTARSFAKLASRLGLAAVGYRAEGSAFGTTVTLMDTRAADRTPSISISCPLVRPMDLRLSIAMGSAAPPAKTEEHQPLGNLDLDAWLTVWGDGDVSRAAALLEADLTSAMRALAGRAGIKLTDALITAFVDATAPLATQEEVLREVVALRGTIHAATRLVPASLHFSKALPAFQRYAAELGVEATTCPFGLFGVVEGCAVDVFRFLPAKSGDVLLVHVAFPSPLAGDWLLNSHLGRSFRARLSSVVETLLAVGPKPGWLRFGSRFKAARGSFADVHAALGELAAMATLAKSDRAFLNVSPQKIVTGVRIRDLSSPPDFSEIVRDLVAVARRIHGVAPMSGNKSGVAPYR